MVHMGLPLKLLSTAAAGALDVWVGIITGVALGLPPALSGAVSIASAVVGVTLVVVAGERLQQLIYRSRRLARRRERVERVWKRYGIPGVALQAPLLTGPLLATLLALALGAPPRPLLGWMIASIVLWGAAITGAAALGLSVFSG
ncbi:MAG: small multi-drug export protein [Actinomycetota bacterium]|nr:small multi-drug export protein [Actinomycetota bacterium]